MAKGSVLKAVVVKGADVSKGSLPIRISLFNEDGTPLELISDAESEVMQAAAHDDSEASTIKELVADFNSLLSKLRDAGVLAS